mmetsp:Transcript_36191/g.75667  ORF Transcript_36191/g.75667 Transcript_36191/m.75667 type:complete len:82 (-) Transcript_36191:417-662(-)
MPLAFIIVPIMLGAGVFGALTFASQETEDMSPAEQTKRLNTEATARMEKDDELRKKILAADVSREAYRESVVKKTEEGVDL